ncbi:hypothetical protein OIO90_001942 [Microbotryomycetes sp. JL221]|nr:hypothetical protein OIO90_001942 [Microbotryomycetes sp. JL221]
MVRTRRRSARNDNDPTSQNEELSAPKEQQQHVDTLAPTTRESVVSGAKHAQGLVGQPADSENDNEGDGQSAPDMRQDMFDAPSNVVAHITAALTASTSTAASRAESVQSTSLEGKSATAAREQTPPAASMPPSPSTASTSIIHLSVSSQSAPSAAQVGDIVVPHCRVGRFVAPNISKAVYEDSDTPSGCSYRGELDGVTGIDTPSPESASSPRRRRQRSKPDGHTPRPPNAWILYRSAQIQKLKADAVVSRKPQAEISKLVGYMWRDESHETKRHYEELAAAKKLEHQLLYPDYTFKPQRRGVVDSKSNRPSALRRQTAPPFGPCRSGEHNRVVNTSAFPSCLLTPDAQQPPALATRSVEQTSPLYNGAPSVPTSPALSWNNVGNVLDITLQRFEREPLPSGLVTAMDHESPTYEGMLTDEVTSLQSWVPLEPDGDREPPPTTTSRSPYRHYIAPYSAPATVSKFNFGDVVPALEVVDEMLLATNSLALEVPMSSSTTSSSCSTMAPSLSSGVDDGESCFSAATSLASPISLGFDYSGQSIDSYAVEFDHHHRSKHGHDDYVMSEFIHDFEPPSYHDHVRVTSPDGWPLSAPPTCFAGFGNNYPVVSSDNFQMHEYEHSLDGASPLARQQHNATQPQHVPAQQDRSPFMFPFALE